GHRRSALRHLQRHPSDARSDRQSGLDDHGSIATTISRREPTTSRTHEPNKSQGTTPALLSNRSTCLIADLANNPRAVARACPIKETASAAPVITPSVPLAKDRTRLACKSSTNARRKNS